MTAQEAATTGATTREPTDTAALLRQVYDALDDVPALMQLCAPDVVIRYPGEGALAYGGTWRGRDGFVRMLGAHEDEEEILGFELRDLVGRQGRVVGLGLFRGRAKSSGRVWTTEFAHVATFRDGLLVRFEAFFDTAAAIEAHRDTDSVEPD